MFSTTQIAAFALSFLSVSLGRPLGSETPIRRVGQHVAVRAPVVQPQVLPQVVRAKVVARDAPATCSSCNATLTFTVSGTATATAAFTFTFPASTASPSTIGSFGSCTIPQIEFGPGFDGLTETSFRPVDQVSYNHTSADNIGVIADFICSALVDTCSADSTAQATCAKAQAAAAAQPPQQGIDADAFNAVFGIQTNFKDVPTVSSAGITSSTSASSTSVEAQPASSTATVAAPTGTTESTTSTIQSAATSTDTPTTTSSALAAPVSSTTAATIASLHTNNAATSPLPTNTGSNNLQTFTGTLGGSAAPAVVVSGSQFLVVGNSLFQTKGDALVRSCSVQKNLCANAANKSGNKGSFTVSACNTQQGACNAAGGT
ncbi:hypothetical protein B0H16DRAFT_1511849 [Mycena metata]|uniref:Uncharacterized protein n=1 Tax=Mycena metata TaxID=1033252 RepID=A0AAD7JWL7_9AGAR|nr:hypothetical protein B0H16DRAFT_1511849 [Mycena metata]